MTKKDLFGKSKTFKEHPLIAQLKTDFKPYFFVSEKMSSSRKKFLVLRPDTYFDFIKAVVRSDIDQRLKVYLLIASSGACRSQEVLQMRRRDFRAGEDFNILATVRVLKKGAEVRYQELVEHFLKHKANQSAERLKKRRASLEKALSAWHKVLREGVKSSLESVDGDDLKVSKKLIQELTKISRQMKKDPMKQVISSEFGIRFEIFKEELSLGYSKKVVNDITALKELFDEVKKTGAINPETRSFEIIEDADGDIRELLSDYISQFREDEFIFQSHWDLKKPYEERSGKPLDTSNLNRLLQKEIGNDGKGLSSHSFRHSLISFMLSNGRTPMEVVKILKLSSVDVVNFYANLEKANKIFSGKI